MPDSPLNTDLKSPKANRRKFLKIIGGGVIIAAAGSGAYLSTRTPHRALAPWNETLATGSDEDPRRVALSYAILAPNPHNRQPWLVDLVGDDVVELYCDLDRRLPHTDPYDRQITIGLGCFLELLEIAATQTGYRTEITNFPHGEGFPRLDERPVARIRFVKDSSAKADPLFAHVFDRRSNKDAFDMAKPVKAADAKAISSVGKHQTLGGMVMEQDRIEILRSLTWNAMDLELRTYRTAKESVDLMRVGKAEIEANPDGIDLGGPLFETLSLAGMFDPEGMLDPNSSMFHQSVAVLKPAMDTAMGYVFIKTEGNSRKAQIAAGRDYVRMNLKATELGIAYHPMSQALQEFEEMKPFYDEIRNELGVSASQTLQMFARIGYGAEISPSPRWPYETRIRKDA